MLKATLNIFLILSLNMEIVASDAKNDFEYLFGMNLEPTVTTYLRHTYNL